ncbi:response regulator transcription factor [Labilibaculum sp.]|uniref:LytR/AlgR family response regulator transcription factor n=1 Tax=Labilibaculum sp. TaxID=2060723 RepID=UPI002AA8095E|nr:response regulator transcription factor [Labilibaculum sp.]MBN2597633.1 response regulator transcription factor [Marinifilaceae bacterium]
MKSKIRILIVEDEYVIDEGILCCLNDLDYEIVKTVYHSKSALKYLVNAEIDIVLIDVNLNDDLNGFQLAEIIKCEFRIPFIFLISTDRQICIEKLTETNPSVIVLQNPTLNQIHFSLILAVTNNEKLNSSLGENKEENSSLDQLNNCLFLKKNNHFERVNFEEIFWLRAENNYTVIHTTKGDYLYSTVLKKFTAKLPGNQFVRIHRSYIVNVTKIDGFEGKMVMIDGQPITVAKTYYNNVFDLLHTV